MAKLTSLPASGYRRVRHMINQRRWLKEQIGKLKPHVRPDDVFFVGHPKSGNTWLGYMLGLLVNPEKIEEITTATMGQYMPVIHASDQRIPEFEHLPSPRIFRNEGPRFPDIYPKTLYVVRDPRSVLVSYYHHCKHDTSRDNWTLDAFVDEMLEHGCIRELEPFVVRWDVQVLDWLQRQQSQPVHVVRYEDMKEDCLGELRKAAAFIGVDASEQLLERAVERGDFSSMRKQEEKYGAEAFPGEKGKKGFFMRKGEVEGWRKELSERSIERIESTFAEAMQAMGYATSN